MILQDKILMDQLYLRKQLLNQQLKKLLEINSQTYVGVVLDIFPFGEQQIGHNVPSASGAITLFTI